GGPLQGFRTTLGTVPGRLQIDQCETPANLGVAGTRLEGLDSPAMRVRHLLDTRRNLPNPVARRVETPDAGCHGFGCVAQPPLTGTHWHFSGVPQEVHQVRFV